MILDGKRAAQGLLDYIRSEVRKMDRPPKLACVLVGDDYASKKYVNNKRLACADVGIESTIVHLPADCDEMRLASVIKALNADSAVDGIMVQLPLPTGIRSGIIELIDPRKDVDGLTTAQAGLLAKGMGELIPCTAQGIMRLLKFYMIDVSGLNVCIIGRSQLVGRPLAQLMEQADATVTLCHSKTLELCDKTRRADIVVAAVGRPCFIRGDMVSTDTILIDVGINRVDGKTVGDCAPDACAKAYAYTPVPGGVGKMTVAELLNNTLIAAKRR